MRKASPILQTILFAFLCCFQIQTTDAQQPPAKAPAKPELPTEGKPFKTNISKDVTMSLLWCPPGKFTMGSPTSESGRMDEEPLHTVSITQGFWMAETETTQAQWQVVKKVNQEQQLKRSNRFGELTITGADVPIYHVSYHDAMDFCKKLTESARESKLIPDGYVFKLPTEAQWEYACRAGTTAALNNNKELSDKLRCPNADEVAWFRGNSYISNDTQPPGPHPVAKKTPNAWGFYDMHGNVSEWCLDKAVFDYEKDVITTIGQQESNPVWTQGREAIIRGGSWASPATMCRSASRRCQPLQTRGSNLGFRIVLVKQ
ncbi:MAG: formylglycine-generating enzyme family protein [Victivallales bacterium]|nr:formylglycine-generating enzyme family protein [Victivallales bacterium]